MRNRILVLLACAFLGAAGLLWFRSAPRSSRPAGEPAASPAPHAIQSSFTNAGDPTGASSDEPDPDDPISARAIVTFASGGERTLAALDGEFARMPVTAGEVLAITLPVHRFRGARAIRVDADNGGSLNHTLGPIEDLAVSADGTVAFTFAVGGHRGRYTVEISQGPVRELLEFWVGPVPPSGEAGPARSFPSSARES